MCRDDPFISTHANLLLTRVLEGYMSTILVLLLCIFWLLCIQDILLLCRK